MMMLTEVWRETSVRIIVNNFKSLLQDKTYDEWLMKETVTAIIRIDVTLVNILMIDLNV